MADTRTPEQVAADKKAKEEQKFARKGEIATSLRRLANHPDWALLMEIFEKKKTRDVEVMSRMILAGKMIPEEQLHYERGFWDGVGAVLKRPENAEAAFQAALSRLAEDDAENAEQ